MSTQAIALLTVCTLVTLVCLGIWLHPYGVARRRRHIASKAFPKAWRTILRRRVPLVAKLPANLQLQLKQHIQVFIAEKPFIGCAGLHITDEMRVVIAAQACLLTLNKPTGHFKRLTRILVYPGAFAVPRNHVDEVGLAREGREALTGESWSQGQVVLSWQDTLAGAADPSDGHNVVIHEFAHQLDQADGFANGAPPDRTPDPIPDPSPDHPAHRTPVPSTAQATWAEVFQRAFDQLQHEAALGLPSLLNPYGAKDPAEFFAVASEVFFEQPQALSQTFGDLYDKLCGYYRVNPLLW